MNLLFCIDRGFIPLLGTCVRSILKNGGYENAMRRMYSTPT